jgi:sugar lactone lactonase YvrE
MKYRLSPIWSSAHAAVATAFAFACSQTPAPETPAQPEPPPAAAAAEPAQPEAAAPIIIKDAGFQTPESILHEPTADIYLLSNINGSPLAKDDNGFISKISPEGKVLELKWIDGSSADVELNAPKGLGISGGKLYVADIDVIRVYDLATGKPQAPIKVDGASFLNDVSVAPDGTVYVSDTGLKGGKDGALEPAKKDAIYKVDTAGKLSTLIKGEQLALPNGLSADDKGLWVATWQGKVYRVTNDGKQETPLTAPGAQLDGVVQTGDGNVIVSSWEKSMVYLQTPDGQFSPLLADLNAPADIGFDSKRGQVLVPLFKDNSVQIQKLPQLNATAKTETPAANATAEANKTEPAK